MTTAPATTSPATPARSSTGRVRPRGERSPIASVGLHLTLIVASVIAVFPVLWVVLTSLKPAAYATTTDFFKETTFANYTNLIQNTKFLTWFGNSLLIAGLTTLLGVIVSASTGYAVSRFRFPGKRGLMWTLLITQMFPVAVLIVPIYNIMAGMGLLNQPAGLVITYLTISVPFCAWMMKGFFDTIPREIDESGQSTASPRSARSGGSSCRSPSPASLSRRSTPSSPRGAKWPTPPPSWSARTTSPSRADCSSSSTGTEPSGAR